MNLIIQKANYQSNYLNYFLLFYFDLQNVMSFFYAIIKQSVPQKLSNMCVSMANKCSQKATSHPYRDIHRSCVTTGTSCHLYTNGSLFQSCLVSNLELERKYFRKKEVPKKGIFEIFFCYILHEQKQMKKMRKLIRTNSYLNLQYFRKLQI